MGISDHTLLITRVVISFAYGLQLLELLFLAVPSSFSTFSLLTRDRDQEKGDSPNGSRVLPLALCALGALLGALIPLLFVLDPGVLARLLPLFTASPSSCLAGSVLVILGSAMTLIAVLTLRQGGRFDRSGESERLITRGIFSLLRHPIGAGLGLIYLGFFLLVPSIGVLIGLLLFFINARYRMAWEEAELRRRFGNEYQAYAARVGALGFRL